MQQSSTQEDQVLYQNISKKEKLAVKQIETYYLCYRDKKMFKMLKTAVRAAEKTWSYDIIRRIAPHEIELLKDVSFQFKVRFRLGGDNFPPIAMFKIFIVNQKTSYYSGRNNIIPTNLAASGALMQMGHRKYYDQMIIDACHFEKNKITDIIDVSTAKDFIQLQNNTDETPSYLGGKCNYWRKLTLENVPRCSIMHDIVMYLHSTGTPSNRLKQHMSTLLSRPITPEIRRKQYEIVSNLPFNLSPLPFTKSPLIKTPSCSGRRSGRSRSRISKMRRLYSSHKVNEIKIKENESVINTAGTGDYSNINQSVVFDDTNKLNVSSPSLIENEKKNSKHTKKIDINLIEAEPSEKEANLLYEWSKKLDLTSI